jgi:hypothetical protein
MDWSKKIQKFGFFIQKTKPAKRGTVRTKVEKFKNP